MILNFKTLTCLLTLLISFSSFQQIQHTERSITLADMQGAWTIGETKNNCSVAEMLSKLIQFDDLYIENDTIFAMRYPCVIYEKWGFHLQSDSLYINGNTNPLGHLKILKNEWILSSPQVCIKPYSKDSTQDNYIVQHFQRAVFDPKNLQILKRVSFNPDCLIGKMVIKTHFSPDDEAAFDIIPPVSMPKSFYITEPIAALIVGEKKIRLSVKGKSRLFNVNIEPMRFHQESEKIFIEVSPAGWWKKEPFIVRYEISK